MEDGKEYTVYFDVENIVPVPEGLGDEYGDWAYQQWGCLYVCKDGQDHRVLDDSDVIFFDTPWDPPVLAIRALSAMFPANTLILDYEVDPPSGVTLFRGGRHSLYWTIPNYNVLTGKTATLYEILVAVLRRTGDVLKAQAEVERVKAERFSTADDTPKSSTCDPTTLDLTYDSALVAEVVAILSPRLYDVTMIPADEKRIADLLTDEAQVATLTADCRAKTQEETCGSEVEGIA